MDVQKVDMFIMLNKNYFESHDLPYIRERLLAADENQATAIIMMQFYEPTVSLIVSLLGGSLGIDRFMIGDSGLGIAKLLTCGGMGIWAIVDWFLIQAATREKNRDKILSILGR